MIMTCVNRKSGYLLTAKMPSGTSASLNSAKERAFRPVPPELRQTLTVDNGNEFAGHQRLSARLEMPPASKKLASRPLTARMSGRQTKTQTAC
jgi:IS30 family transposase